MKLFSCTAIEQTYLSLVWALMRPQGYLWINFAQETFYSLIFSIIIKQK